jgi:hypothetical protein
MTDELSARLADLLDGTYDCVDRIVLNGYHSLCYSAGGFRLWWRSLMGGSEEQLDNTHLMCLAGRFSRRVRGFAKAMTAVWYAPGSFWLFRVTRVGVARPRRWPRTWYTTVESSRG